jgi:hypothetical protein
MDFVNIKVYYSATQNCSDAYTNVFEVNTVLRDIRNL